MAMAFTASSLCAAPKRKGNNANYCSSGGKVLNIYSYIEVKLFIKRKCNYDIIIFAFPFFILMFCFVSLST